MACGRRRSRPTWRRSCAATIRETVDQDGKTRIRERYTVSAPLAGRLLRIELDPGDEVDAGETLVASIEPRDPDLLDARAVLQAEANVKAAEAQARSGRRRCSKKRSPIEEFAEAELKRLATPAQDSPRLGHATARSRAS